MLALFDEGSPFIREFGLPQYRPLFTGLNISTEEIERVRARLTGEDWDEESGGFRDRYGVGVDVARERCGKWQTIGASSSPNPALSSGSCRVGRSTSGRAASMQTPAWRVVMVSGEASGEVLIDFVNGSAYGSVVGIAN